MLLFFLGLLVGGVLGWFLWDGKSAAEELLSIYSDLVSDVEGYLKNKPNLTAIEAAIVGKIRKLRDHF